MTIFWADLLSCMLVDRFAVWSFFFTYLPPLFLSRDVGSLDRPRILEQPSRRRVTKPCIESSFPEHQLGRYI